MHYRYLSAFIFHPGLRPSETVSREKSRVRRLTLIIRVVALGFQFFIANAFYLFIVLFAYFICLTAPTSLY